MNKTNILLATAAAIALGATIAAAQEYTAGEVTKIDAAQKKLTIKHGELANLDMPAMTMVFVVAEDSMIEEVKVGQKIEFTADRVNGRITVTDIK
ncbi:copper-binding protein [Aquibium sp. LZ166]|uniref:Copper-binding protein n=1 Tax=Aquibium pacificus TaxID=3153579 RepID=A0ABV3SGD0_9HYPH